jgi:LDH2 family malate/lactate/ureidoglycolate dehydrogenase
VTSLTDASPVDTARLVAAAQLQATLAAVLRGLGCPDAEAGMVADSLIEADLTGAGSHGAHLLPLYTSRIVAGHVRPGAPVTVIRDLGATLWLDAGLGLGQVAGQRAAAEAAARAERHGAAVVAVREATHLGALAGYVRRIAQAGCVGLCVQNGPAVVPPFGGVEPLLSTNPLAFAAPTLAEPMLVFDMATTAVAGNRLLLAKLRGEPSIPPGWACDASGQPTTDTQAASIDHLQWFGGHKGFGLAVMVEVLSGLLAGSSFGLTDHTASELPARTRVAKGFTVIALDPERFLGRAAFRLRMDELIREIRASPPAPGVERVRAPGERGAALRAERLATGVPLPPELIAEIDALARRYGAPTLGLEA